EYVVSAAKQNKEGNIVEASELYARAAGTIGPKTSMFDRLWLDLNRVDTQIRIGAFDDARENLRHLVSASREYGFRWMTAKALSIYGYTPDLTSSYSEMLSLV